MTVLVILFFILIFFVDTIPLYKSKQWLDFWVSMVLLTFAFSLTLLLSLGVKIPSPAKPLGSLIKYITGQQT